MSPGVGWKAAKEAFVSGHGGSTFTDVAVVCAVVPLCVGLRLHLGRLFMRGCRRGKRDTCLDLLVIVLPTAVALTVGAFPLSPERTPTPPFFFT